MNIGMFTNAYLPVVGGLEQSIATFVEDLRRLDQRVFVVTLTFPGAEESDETIIRLPAIQEVSGTEFSIRLPIPVGLGQRLDALAPDVIHSHHPFMLGDTALRVARSRGAPLVFTHHTLYERYAYRFRRESETLEQIARSIATEYANLCDLVVAPTPSIEQLLRQRGVRTPIEVIPTGVDTALFGDGDGNTFRSRHGIPGEAFVLGYLGRVVDAKNVAFLADAGARFLQQSPDARYLIVGEGEARDGMRDTFEAAGVADRVVLTGNLSGRSVADAYAAMDLFAFASETETQGIVLIESLAAGTPVVALDAPAVRDILDDGETGRLLPMDATPEGFADALGRLRNDREERLRLGRNARRRAREFDRLHCARRLLEVYRSLLEERKGKPIAPHAEETDLWTVLQARFAAEWDLFKEKLAVAADTFLGEP